jgi:hypothetical protein
VLILLILLLSPVPLLLLLLNKLVRLFIPPFPAPPKPSAVLVNTFSWDLLVVSMCHPLSVPPPSLPPSYLPTIIPLFSPPIPFFSTCAYT